MQSGNCDDSKIAIRPLFRVVTSACYKSRRILTFPGESRRDRIVKLHQHYERDTPGSTDHGERHSCRIEPLGNYDPPFDGVYDVRWDIVLQKARPLLRIPKSHTAQR